MAKDRYRIKHIIGEGASGTVYRAVDNTDGREVAIKVHSGGREGFDHECNMLKKLEHEHIVKLYGEEGGMLVFELCDYNLISFMNEHELDMRCIKRIVRMILLGLRHMHERGIIHRDIKLGNVLVKGDSIKLCDFGLSCLKAQNDFSYCGTRDYLAPEIGDWPIDKSRALFYDEKIDVFAAGIICRTLITRRKGVELDMKKTDADVAGLLRSMLEPDPKKRCSAEQALRHKAFDSIFPDIPDFRTIRSFSKGTKHGVVERDQKHIQIQYQSEGEQILKIEAVDDGDTLERLSRHDRNKGYPRAPNRPCKCMTDPSYRVAINGKRVDERFLAETELKHYIFLCSYFKIIAERTTKVRLEEGDHVFTMTANNTRILEHRDYKLTKSRRGWDLGRSKLPVECGQHLEIPHKMIAIFDYFESMALSTPHKCFFQQTGMESCSSMSLPALNDPLVKEYVFARDIGWCVKNRLRFTILLNDGTRFDLYADEEVMVTCDHKRIRIGKGVPEHYKGLLRISRTFLQKFT